MHISISFRLSASLASAFVLLAGTLHAQQPASDSLKGGDGDTTPREQDLIRKAPPPIFPENQPGEIDKGGGNLRDPNQRDGLTGQILYQYLISPQAYVPGTKMTYPGLKDAQKRADVIAYLKSKPTS